MYSMNINTNYIYLTSNNFRVSELTPAANTKPSGSKAATGLPITLI